MNRLINKILCFMWECQPIAWVWLQREWEPKIPELDGKTFYFCIHCGAHKHD